MVTAKLENKDIKKLTINSKTAIGEEIKYDTPYFKGLEKLEVIALNGFDVDNNLIEKLNYLKELKTIIFNHCKFSNDDKLVNNIENIIITYSNIINLNIIDKLNNLKTVELIGIDEVDINDIAKIKNLVELSIYNSKIRHAIKINDFANLKILKLDGSLVDEPNFSKIHI